MPQVNPIRKPHESGYAILMVFLLAATIAIGMYAVAPRVAFESQRDKEQLLVDRGEQYKRAIQLYYRKFRKYPVKMEDLENTSNIRFLRKRYVDPMTGKDEWRLIHVGPGGQFLDSLTQKKTTTQKTDASVNTFIAEYKSVADPNDAVDQLSPALRRRPSDQAAANGATLGGSGDSMAAPADPNNPTPNPNNDANLNAAFTPGGAVPGGIPGNPALAGSGDGSGAPAGDFTGTPTNGQLPGTNVAGGAGPMQTFNPAGGPAAIQQLLTSPRPGGPPPGIFNPSGRPMNDYGFVDANGNNIPSPANPQPVISSPGSGGFGGATTAGGSAFGGSSFGGQSVSPASTLQTGASSQPGNFATGSFAGVASTVKRKGIKKYADYSKYNEWEFIYDYSKDVAKASGLPVNGATGANGNSLPLNGAQSAFGNTQGTTTPATNASPVNSTPTPSPASN
jgi:hypothetical protein